MYLGKNVGSHCVDNLKNSVLGEILWELIKSHFTDVSSKLAYSLHSFY